MTGTFEVNFDGLVGPTHNYGGLSLGNLASMASHGQVSNPKAAALQGLKKMRALLGLGLPQAVLPPHDRPHMAALRRFGFTGTDAEVLETAYHRSPALVHNLSSASAMWTANAATISPSADSADGKVHFTAANLGAMFHRSIEHGFTAHLLKTIFADPAYFSHHQPIPYGGAMGDEGAANHGRLCAAHGEGGVELFTYGRAAFETLTGWTFLPRQALEASEAIARMHAVEDNTVYLRQSRKAIEAGAFHNDVVAVANGPVLMFHEKAYEEKEATLDHIRQSTEAFGFKPQFLEVADKDVPLKDAITSYLFNSQLVSLPDGGMTLILPSDAEENSRTKAWVDAQLGSNGPIVGAHYFDLKQSMKNGGGPACLRLRVVLTDEERSAVAPGVLLDTDKIDALETWVDRHYRDRLSPDDLGDPQLLMECRIALDELTQLLQLGSLYAFQQTARP